MALIYSFFIIIAIGHYSLTRDMKALKSLCSQTHCTRRNTWPTTSSCLWSITTTIQSLLINKVSYRFMHFHYKTLLAYTLKAKQKVKNINLNRAFVYPNTNAMGKIGHSSNNLSVLN